MLKSQSNEVHQDHLQKTKISSSLAHQVATFVVLLRPATDGLFMGLVGKWTTLRHLFQIGLTRPFLWNKLFTWSIRVYLCQNHLTKNHRKLEYRLLRGFSCTPCYLATFLALTKTKASRAIDPN